MIDLQSIIERVQAEIKIATFERNRVKAEIETKSADSNTNLPEDVVLDKYKSNSKSRKEYWYHCVRSRSNALQSAGKRATKVAGLTSKLHLGRSFNPRYRDAIVAIEAKKINQIKKDTFERLTEHLNHLEDFLERLLSAIGDTAAAKNKDLAKDIKDFKSGQ